MKKIVNGNIWYKGKFIKNKPLYFEKRIYESEEALALCEIGEQEIESIDAKGAYVLPGFIDVHIHGYMGKDVMDGEKESLEKIAVGICENGVTAFLPTTMTMDLPKIEKALDTVKESRAQEINGEINGAMILGAHLEGPFIHKDKKGAQPEEFIIPPNANLIEKYKDVLKIITIAPEVEGAIEIIEKYSDSICFSIGHTTATYAQAMKAYEAGAKSTTHMFNAMTGLLHREPGVVGASMSCDCYGEVIADNIHLHKGIYSLLAKTKGLERLLLITDCMQAGGMQDGDYELGGQKVKVSHNKCTLTDGTIAGSVLKLNEGLRNFTTNTNYPLEKVMPIVTENQAKLLKVEDEMGTLEVGKLANITIMDKAYHIRETYVKGKKIYENQI